MNASRNYNEYIGSPSEFKICEAAPDPTAPDDLSTPRRVLATAIVHGEKHRCVVSLGDLFDERVRSERGFYDVRYIGRAGGHDVGRWKHALEQIWGCIDA
jgi:hypothetical protein